MISMHTSPLEQPGIGDAGGMNVYVLASARQLARQGISVDIFTRATRSSTGEITEVEENLRVINIVAGPFEGLSKDDLPTQLAAFAGGILCFSRCHHLQYDLIHSHYWLSGQVAWLLRDLWRIPFVHTAHTLAAVKNQALTAAELSGIESDARRICEQQVVDNADVLVVNTAEEAIDLERHYDADPAHIAVVSPGADTNIFCPGTGRATEAARRELGVPLHLKVVAFVGRLQPFKGPDVLIAACAELVRRGMGIRVLICGGSSGVEPLLYQEMVQEKGLSRVIRFLEPRPPADLLAIYQAADLVAVPSYNESFGLVALEAQATGTPVVAARVGGLPIAVVDGITGKLVDGHDPIVWANALEELLSDDAHRMEMGQQAVKHAAAFSWEATAQRLSAVYREALATSVPECPSRQARGV